MRLTIGNARRRGMCKIRHLDVTELWIQEKFNSKCVCLRMVLGTENPADMFTKYTERSIINMAMGKMNMQFIDGRSDVVPAAMGTSANADTQP